MLANIYKSIFKNIESIFNEEVDITQSVAGIRHTERTKPLLVININSINNAESTSRGLRKRFAAVEICVYSAIEPSLEHMHTIFSITEKLMNHLDHIKFGNDVERAENISCYDENFEDVIHGVKCYTIEFDLPYIGGIPRKMELGLS